MNTNNLFARAGSALACLVAFFCHAVATPYATSVVAALRRVDFTYHAPVTSCVRYVYGTRGNAGYFHNSCGFSVYVEYHDQGPCSNGCGELVPAYGDEGAQVSGGVRYGACHTEDNLVEEGGRFLCRYGA
jgi:hypothetical protein